MITAAGSTKKFLDVATSRQNISRQTKVRQLNFPKKNAKKIRSDRDSSSRPKGTKATAFPLGQAGSSLEIAKVHY